MVVFTANFAVAFKSCTDTDPRTDLDEGCSDVLIECPVHSSHSATVYLQWKKLRPSGRWMFSSCWTLLAASEIEIPVLALRWWKAVAYKHGHSWFSCDVYDCHSHFLPAVFAFWQVCLLSEEIAATANGCPNSGWPVHICHGSTIKGAYCGWAGLTCTATFVGTSSASSAVNHVLLDWACDKCICLPYIVEAKLSQGLVLVEQLLP